MLCRWELISEGVSMGSGVCGEDSCCGCEALDGGEGGDKEGLRV